MAERIVVDGSNVAHIEVSQQGDPKVSNIQAVREALRDRGYDPVVIVDASLRHKIDDPDQLEALIDEQRVRQAPSGTDADVFVLKMADNWDAQVVSNDTFEGYEERYPWIEERRVPLMIISGEVEFSGLRDPRGGE